MNTSFSLTEYALELIKVLHLQYNHWLKLLQAGVKFTIFKKGKNRIVKRITLLATGMFIWALNSKAISPSETELNSVASNAIQYNIVHLLNGNMTLDVQNKSNDFNLPILRKQWLSHNDNIFYTVKECSGYLHIKAYNRDPSEVNKEHKIALQNIDFEKIKKQTQQRYGNKIKES